MAIPIPRGAQRLMGGMLEAATPTPLGIWADELGVQDRVPEERALGWSLKDE